MNKKQQVEKLKQVLFADDWEAQKWASHQLFHFGGRFNKTARRKLRRYLLDLFDQNNVSVRNAVALVVRQNCYQPALRPLLRALQKTENSRSRMTMAYALETLNCSRHLGELFDIVFGAADNYVTLVHVLTVLEEQVFEFTRDELEQIERRWQQVKPTWNSIYYKDKQGLANHTLPGDFNDVVIQDFVDGYLAYLK